MSTSSPSPTLPRALWSLFAVVFFPILAIRIAAKCASAGKSEWIGLLLFALIGAAEIAAFIWNPHATFVWIGIRTWAFIAYAATWFLCLAFIAVVKDEMDKSSV